MNTRGNFPTERPMPRYQRNREKGLGRNYNPSHIQMARSFVKLDLPNGDSYEGQASDGIPQGLGTYRWVSGDWYEGDWQQGLRTGSGTYHWSNGDFYDGEFEENMFCGIGEAVYVSKGEKYMGSWQNSLRHGEGTYVFDSGSYEGSWKDDMRHGQGTWRSTGTEDTVEVYVGGWERDAKHGSGVLTIGGDRFRYGGDFSAGEMDGSGMAEWKEHEFALAPFNAPPYIQGRSIFGFKGLFRQGLPVVEGSYYLLGADRCWQLSLSHENEAQEKNRNRNANKSKEENEASAEDKAQRVPDPEEGSSTTCGACRQWEFTLEAIRSEVAEYLAHMELPPMLIEGNMGWKTWIHTGNFTAQFCSFLRQRQRVWEQQQAALCDERVKEAVDAEIAQRTADQSHWEKHMSEMSAVCDELQQKVAVLQNALMRTKKDYALVQEKYESLKDEFTFEEESKLYQLRQQNDKLRHDLSRATSTLDRITSERDQDRSLWSQTDRINRAEERKMVESRMKAEVQAARDDRNMIQAELQNTKKRIEIYEGFGLSDCNFLELVEIETMLVKSLMRVREEKRRSQD